MLDPLIGIICWVFFRLMTANMPKRAAMEKR